MHPLLEHLATRWRRLTAAAPVSRVLVAFSGGPDSTALLHSLVRLTQAKLPGESDQAPEILAAHLDHGIDEGSSARAQHARQVAATLGVPLTVERRDLGRLRPPGKSLEVAAREARYEFLERIRSRAQADVIAVAHHQDDQAETVLLRILYGSGVSGLQAMQEQTGRLWRPLLTRTREEILDYLAARNLEACSDPSNENSRFVRVFIRQRLLPHLETAQPDLRQQLLRLAATSQHTQGKIDASLRRALPGLAHGTLDRHVLASLPESLWPFALAALSRRAGTRYPPTARARRELRRQLASRGRIGCDCGDGWRWREISQGQIAVVRGDRL